MVKEPLESKSVFPGSSSTCYGTLAFCFLCFADSSAYPAPVSCGRYAYCVPCQIQHKYVNCCMKVATYAIVWESIDRQVLYGSRITAAACQLHVLIDNITFPYRNFQVCCPIPNTHAHNCLNFDPDYVPR